ncbi:MAG: 4,5-DOPA dioxygenase extradiol [Candidatus Eremiobacteraeota bacterium]|nr:4,5-DOPA dioxygenase extradiol [Candidatus Eremiobacteraeota bacterium]
MNAITDTPYSRAWKALGEALPRPRAILVVSAHWYIRETAVTAMERPPTIHDFGGFPPALHAIEYPAPGDPEVAREIARMLAPLPVSLDTEWGLDHGAWSLLLHTHPAADIPVLQLSMDATKPPSFHYALGEQLAQLRDQGVLIIGSGNIVHNLRMMGDIHGTYDWATRFDDYIRTALQTGDRDALISYARHPDARMAVPTPEHYLPLLYIAALARAGEDPNFIIDGSDLASISMTAFTIGV